MIQLSDRKRKRRMQKNDSDGIAMLILFLFLFPYTISLLLGNGEPRESSIVRTENMDYTIICENGAGEERIPLETYLIGVVASSIDMEYELETLKVQSIILRTICRKALGESKVEEVEENRSIQAQELDLVYWDENRMRNKWGEEYQQYLDKITQAVDETKNMVITYQGNLIEAPFFTMSNGKTRSGNEIFKTEEYPYLQTVACADVMMAENYLHTITLSKGEFLGKVNSLLQGAEFDAEDQFVLELDEAGYVNQIVIGEHVVSGELFRQEMGILSSCYEMSNLKNQILITTKGIGHGIGLDQFQANVFAKNGKNFIDILSYFYQGIEIEKYV